MVVYMTHLIMKNNYSLIKRTFLRNFECILLFLNRSPPFSLPPLPADVQHVPAISRFRYLSFRDRSDLNTLLLPPGLVEWTCHMLVRTNISIRLIGLVY